MRPSARSVVSSRVLALCVPAVGVLAGCRADSGLVKINASPDAQITAPVEGASAVAGTPLTLRGAVSDTNHDAAELAVRWFVDDVEACGGTPAADGSTTCDVVVPDADDADLRLEVTDPEGAAGSDGRILDVTPNEAPTVEIEIPVADGVYYADQLLTLRATVDDAEDDPSALQVRWESSADGELDAPEPNSEGLVESFVQLSQGPHALQVFVTDSVGNEGQASVVIDVGPPNASPECGITAPADGGASAEGERVDFGARVSDVDVAPDWLSVEWSSDQDGALASSTPDSEGQVLFSTGGLSRATHRITLRVTDEVGATCTDAITWTVGSPPSITLESPLDGAVLEEGELATFRARVSDEEDVAEDLTVAWESRLDGLLHVDAPDSTGVAQFLTGDLSPGAHGVTVTVTDTDGLYATALVTLVVNAPPVVTDVVVTPASGRVGDTLTCTASASDPDGSAPSVSYAWSNGASGSSVTLAAADDPGDVLTCTVTATDADGSSAVGSASAVVLNTDPTLAVSVSPTAADNDDVLACTAVAADADGGAPALVYAWTNATTGVSLGAADTLALDSSLASAGDTVACAVTATDADGGAASATASVALGNRDPSVTASLTPTSPLRSSTLTCAGVATDADGDATALAFAWTVAGAPVAASTTSDDQSTLTAAFDAGETVGCTVTATDGRGGTASDTVAVAVGNTAPSVSSVSIAPDPAYTDDLLTASVASADADGDALSLLYTWYVDGVVVQVGPDATLDGATSFDRDQEVRVEVTADDGAATDTLSSGVLTILNTPPTPPVVSLGPTGASAGDDLVCLVVDDSTDADGDSLSYAFAWDVDGVAYGAAADDARSSTVDGADVGGEETWTCEVTADDGSDLSDVASASLTTACLLGSTSDCAGTTCLDILDAGGSVGDGPYWVDPAGSGAFQAWCDMTTDGGGWTRVGLERAGDTTTFQYLGVEKGSSADVAAGTASGLVGARFAGMYSEFSVTWASYYIRLTPRAEVFDNSVNTSILLDAFSTNEGTLQSWVSSAGGAHFCRASSYTSVRPGDTSWAVKPLSDTNTGCGCNSGSWVGRGAYYAGHASATVCADWPGAWSGTKDSGQQKGGYAVSYDTHLWVR